MGNNFSMKTLKFTVSIITSGESAGGPLSIDENANSGFREIPTVTFWSSIDGGESLISH